MCFPSPVYQHTYLKSFSAAFSFIRRYLTLFLLTIVAVRVDNHIAIGHGFRSLGGMTRSQIRDLQSGL